MRIIRHVIITVTALALIAGVPAFATGYPQRVLSGADAVSSASVILDQPSGAYVVLINRDLHLNAENLKIWEDFFEGEEIGFLFEDISCVVADSDPSGLGLARSFQSRLPENQMGLRTENVTLMMSKFKYGKFDVMLLSREMYDAYADSLPIEDGSVLMIESEGL